MARVATTAVGRQGFGSDGDDYDAMLGGAGRDNLNGDAGDDTLDLDSGNDAQYGGSGRPHPVIDRAGTSGVSQRFGPQRCWRGTMGSLA